MAAKRTTILAADDNPRTLRLIEVGLQPEGYELILARDGQEALQKAETSNPDLLLLDIMMPKLSGLEVCEHIRTFSTVPIMVLTAREQVEDKKRAFDLGADDYLTKPFKLVELVVRVRALLRRAHWSEMGSAQPLRSKARIGNLMIDFSQHQVSVDERPVALTPIEFRILSYLVQNAGMVVTHDLLLEHVWGADYAGENHLLKVNINRLRHKIESDPAHPNYILTRPGIGYMLLVPEALAGKEQREA
jgi:DNA-binding response OmpR family regulator